MNIIERVKALEHLSRAQNSAEQATRVFGEFSIKLNNTLWNEKMLKWLLTQPGLRNNIILKF